jgi:hypothetical protein
MPIVRQPTWIQRAPSLRSLGLDQAAAHARGLDQAAVHSRAAAHSRSAWNRGWGMGDTASDTSGGYTTITTPAGDYQVMANGDVFDPNGNVVHTAATALESNMESGINYLTALVGQGSGSFSDWFQKNQTVVLLAGGAVLLLVMLKGRR